jgi:predicted small lipoprotein YifL
VSGDARGRRHRYTGTVAHCHYGIAMPRPTLRLLAIPLAVLLLAACGNKGDLVLPDQQPKKHKKSPTTAPAKTPDAKPADPGSPAGGADPVH